MITITHIAPLVQQRRYGDVFEKLETLKTKT